MTTSSSARLDPTISIAFIGAGNMASSIAGGLIQNGHPAQQILLCDPSDENRQRAAELLTGAKFAQDNQAAVDYDVILLSVKPQIMQPVCQQLALSKRFEATQNTQSVKMPLVMSVAAGITISQIADWSGFSTATAHLPIVRCMPNTPALVNAGATGYFANDAVSDEQRSVAQAILSAVGIAVDLPNEAALNSVTALSGSGPAYFFLLMESMIEAGQLLGLTHDTAEQLAIQTAYGAAKLAADSASPSPNVLRERVTSPGGTTQAALEHMEQSGMKQIVVEAMKAASDRAIELAQA